MGSENTETLHTMKNKRKVGQKGEEWAANHLIGNGYTIVHRNFQISHMEIDIIAQKEDWLVFVEVKLREDNAHGLPEEKVNFTKKSFLLKAADHYLNQYDWPGRVRFDLIAITLKPFELVHFEDAFY